MISHAPSLKGLVLSLYGTGNGPSAKAEFLDTIRAAVDRGILVVAATQCISGTVNLEVRRRTAMNAASHAHRLTPPTFRPSRPTRPSVVPPLAPMPCRMPARIA